VVSLALEGLLFAGVSADDELRDEGGLGQDSPRQLRRSRPVNT
jgi:hypothetical protein